MSAQLDPKFIDFIVRTYADDFNGYRRDILGMKPAEWQDRVGLSLQHKKRTSVSAAHGIGKTGMAAAAIHWFAATRPKFAIVATANTEDQLQKKLWRELAKVNDQAKNKEWFKWESRTFTRFGNPTTQAIALPNNENNPGAFAGTHEDHVLGVFDEAAEIPDSIWEVFNGAMTTPGARWLAISNPRRSEGFFYHTVFGDHAARREGDVERKGKWNPFVIKAADSPFVPKSYPEEMLGIYKSEQDDRYRIQVLGLPPRTDPSQFISSDMVNAAMEREVPLFKRWPLILGCDVGRGDRSVMLPRRGRKVLDKIEIINGSRTTDFARRIAEEIRFYREEDGLQAEVVIEELGMGVGVVETLQDMGYGDHVWGVNTGNPSNEPNLYRNLRCEMWDLTRQWLEETVELPNEDQLRKDLLTIRKKPSGGTGVLTLESKEDMRRRRLPSPDVGDALALTFSIDVDLLPEKEDGWNDAWKSQSAGASGSWMGN